MCFLQCSQGQVLFLISQRNEIITLRWQSLSISPNSSMCTFNYLFSPYIETKQIIQLWRFMVHRKLNWCLFSTKLLNITRSGISRSACWDTLKQGLHESCTICPRQNARQRLLSIVWLVRPDTYLAFSVCMHTILYAMRWLPGLSVPDSIHFLPISLHAYFMPPIKNAPRWLVKGRWGWRLGLFKDPSQLFKAKFDSENGGGLISHAEVFEGLGGKCNVRCSDEISRSINQEQIFVVD